MKTGEMPIGFMCLTASIAIGCGVLGKTMEMDIEKEVTASPATLKTESGAICSESNSSDSDAMKKKYEGIIMEISGTVTEIEESDMWIESYLGGPCRSGYRVNCIFSNNQRALVKQISKNQKITAKCKASPTPSFFSLHGCILVQ